MTVTEVPYLEAFGCRLDDGEDHAHEGDCCWGFFCSQCSRPDDGKPGPVHAPREIPGLVLADCDATPRHAHTWFYATEGYPPPCMYCAWQAASDAHKGCEHSRHWPWRRWKATRWLAIKGHWLGVVRSHWVTHDSHCHGCVSRIQLGPLGLRARQVPRLVVVPDPPPSPVPAVPGDRLPMRHLQPGPVP